MSSTAAAGLAWTTHDAAGPSWLLERRRLAAETFARLEMPTERDESFRYGRIDDLDLERFSSTKSKGNADPVAASRLLAAIGPAAATIRTLDGEIASITFRDGVAPAGLSVSRISELSSSPVGFGDLLEAVGESLTFFAEAVTTDAAIVEIAPGAAIAAPIVFVHEISEGAAACAVAPRTLCRLSRMAEATVIEFFCSSPSAHLVVPVTEMFVAEGAHLRYHAVQQLGAADWQLAYQLSRVERDGELRSFSAALGGSYARLFTRSDLVGEGAESHLAATYFGKGDQVQDLRTHQEHAVAKTSSDLVFKGAVRDQSRSVYSGMIHIAKGAKRSNAAQTNRNLVLSEGAHADSVPNLNIEENDVRCSHASAVGPIDAEQRFYLESRGLPPAVADRLILLGFFDDLFDAVPNAGCASYLREVFTAEIESVQP